MMANSERRTIFYRTTIVGNVNVQKTKTELETRTILLRAKYANEKLPRVVDSETSDCEKITRSPQATPSDWSKTITLPKVQFKINSTVASRL